MNLANTPETVLVWLLVALGLIVTLILFSAAILISVASIRERRARRLLDAAKKEIASLMSPGKVTPRTGAIRFLPVPLQVRLYRELVPLFSRDELHKVKALLRTADIVAFARELSTSRFWWRRLHGLRILTMFAETVPPDPAWFRDDHLEVRAQAAEWVAASGSTAALPALTSMLSDPIGLCRFTVQDSLQRMGAASVAPLAEFIERAPSAKVTAAIEIAATFNSSALGTAVLRHADAPQPEVRALVADALGSFASEGASESVAKFLHDDSPEVRAAAAKSAGRLRLWPQCKRLAALLRDKDWKVRNAAALALVAIGAPGLVTLRAALKDSDRFAHDIAEQALQIAAIQENA